MNAAPPDLHSAPEIMTSSFMDPEDLPPTHWVSKAAFPIISAALILTQVALGFAVAAHQIWLAIPLMLLVSHFMHGTLIGFHEALSSVL